MQEVLFSPYRLGPMLLRNRVVMAPMTRNRSPQNVPGALVATYYAQRAEAGLIITEGTSPSPNGVGLPRIPGLYNSEQVQAWRAVTEAVHAQGSKILLQLMHTGRVGHPDNLPKGATVVGPSPIALPDDVWTEGGKKTAPTPREMTELDIECAIAEFATAADLAMQAGFDGVELHGGNGLLIDQFLNVACNTRRDDWGGSVENRIRFAVEVARAVAARIGPDRVGMRISPYGSYNGMQTDSLVVEVFRELLTALDTIGLAHIHLVDLSSMGGPPVPPTMKDTIRELFTRTVIHSGGYDRERAEEDLALGNCDLIAFGRPFIANPRLVTLLEQRSALRAFDEASLYTAGPEGYIDYPLLP
ncbi:MAG: alkene reductase [Myxococcota bacterium]